MKQLRIAGYVRVSTEEQASLVDGSLDNQRYRLNAFMDVKNIQETNWGKIVEFYIDDGFSAKDTKRPAFQKMMSDLQKGKIDLILVPDLSRLSRSISDFCGILEILKAQEASFLSIKEQFDTTTPAGKMMLYNIINLAQFEREQTAERVSLGCHARAMRGLLNGGQGILGYDKSVKQKNSYTVNDEEAEKVRIIFKTFLEVGSISKTIRALGELGISPKVKDNGRDRIADRGMWTQGSLGTLLQSHAYVGIKEVNKKNKESDVKRLKPHEKYQLVKATWPAIIEQKTFDAVQSMLIENRLLERRRLAGAERRVFLISGVAKCKECGRAMVGQSCHGRFSVHRYYAHTSSRGLEFKCAINRIRADDVEMAINSHLVQLLRNGNYFDKVVSEVILQSKEIAISTVSLRRAREKDLKQIELEMENAFRLQMQADSSSKSAEFLFEKLEVLGNKKADLKRQLVEMDEDATLATPVEMPQMDLETQVQAASRGWKKLSDCQKRRALRRLIQKVLIGPDGLEVYFFMNSIPNESSLVSRSNEVKEECEGTF